ncbi:mechanosensitive ion channel [Sinorhizobium medicae]|uniref:Mechanosensitive ion channel n=2 Tax=Sinorhizobium medicae TaxID=110321 RepID=A0A6G1WJ56_9HYPH|nr:mechanosensitive ion channel family protein [Sinorhizobium medicae]MQV99300.1 mechanosensitive ion channel [Sinorhizobium medicae]MQW69726.1 mechanosensitive ion channel [Sinorhizobium medicae]MQX82786.1 mechanosensitive ion channel [Sinorhizobium medicae]
MHLLENVRAFSIALFLGLLALGALTLAAGGPAVAQESEPSARQSRPAEPAVPIQPAQSSQPAPQAAPTGPAAGTGGDQPSAAASPVLQQAEDQLAQADRELKRIIERTNAVEDDDAMLAELRAQVDELSKQIIAASVPTRPRLDEIKARLTELGDPPGEGQPPEDAVITDERKRLLAERGAINALTGRAENLSIEARKLANRITATRRAIFSNTLLRHTDVSVEMLSEAATATLHEAMALSRSIGGWLTFAWNYKRVPLLSALFLSLCAALLFLVGGYRLFSPVLMRPEEADEPTYFRRLSLAFWSTLIPTVALAAFAMSSYFFLSSFNILRPDIAPIIAITLAMGVVLFFIARLASAVLSPSRSSWRLVRVSDRGAKMLMVPIFAMALVNGLDYLLGSISESLGSPVVLTIAKSFVASIIIGLILMSMAWIRPVLRGDEPYDAPGHPWPRVISFSFLLLGAALIATALSGYVGLARFIATQITVTSAILVTVYIGLLTGKSVSRQGAFAETVAGRYLERRFQLEPVALDQFGLFAGLGIYVLVLAFFIPLILLQWGFKTADIESWTYRVLTEIRVGTITISLVGILAGILLFALGFLVTRWVQRWIDRNVMARSRVDAGVRNSIRTGIGYMGVGVAGLIGLSAAGIDLSSLALVAGALSLGVGFGLQNIVSNFVSGLILLVERPFKVGDWIVSGTTEGFVRRISVRATEIETFQHQSIMMPNSLLINASVGNWTHRNKLGRSEIAVTVTYDSDPRRIIELLHDIAAAHPMVLKNPAPNVGFTAFGDDRMTFELRIYVADVLTAGGVRNDLRVSIYERFRDEGIGAPFPMKIEDITPEEEVEGANEEPSVVDEEKVRSG